MTLLVPLVCMSTVPYSHAIAAQTKYDRSLRWLPGNLLVMRRLQKVTVPNQEVIPQLTPCNTPVKRFAVFVLVKQTRYDVLMSEF